MNKKTICVILLLIIVAISAILIINVNKEPTSSKENNVSIDTYEDAPEVLPEGNVIDFEKSFEDIKK